MSRYFYIASGFKEDCIKLLTLFNETNSIRFEKFCQVWKEMKFAMIYAGRQTYSELLEYCEEVLHVAKEFVLPPRNFKERIGGLYLLYGLYYKLPIKDVIRIRITQEQWTSLMELQEQLKAGEHLDANFILSTMIHDEVFAHTIFDFEWGLEKFYREKQMTKNKFSIMPLLLEMTESGGNLHELDKLAKEYRQATLLSSSSSSNDNKKSLNLFDENFIQDILLDIQKLETNNFISRTNQTNSDTYNLRSDQQQQQQQQQRDTKSEIDKQKNAKIRSRIGDGFDVDSSNDDDDDEEEDEDEEEENDDDFERFENYNRSLAENFDDDVDDDNIIDNEPDTKRVKFIEVTLPGPHMKFEHGEGSSD